jgi:hypothetical protein
MTNKRYSGKLLQEMEKLEITSIVGDIVLDSISTLYTNYTTNFHIVCHSLCEPPAARSTELLSERLRALLPAFSISMNFSVQVKFLFVTC